MELLVVFALIPALAIAAFMWLVCVGWLLIYSPVLGLASLIGSFWFLRGSWRYAMKMWNRVKANAQRQAITQARRPQRVVVVHQYDQNLPSALD